MNHTIKKPRIVILRHQTEKNSQDNQATRSDNFHKISVKIANKVGTPWAFYLALIIILVWGITGPIFNYSDTWQLIINTGTTIVTFLMVFVIQNTQNRDGKAMQLKLNELINVTHRARSEFVDVEDLTDAELDQLQDQFKEIHDKIHKKGN